VSVHDALGITFGTVTRAFLRHDPDVVLIGEIRDADTAREAVRAALTGRKVLSTLHTQDAIAAIPRLLELGVEPGLLAQTLTGVVAQRLVRLRCKACVGAGCGACGNSGESGRTVVSEVLTISAEVRAAIERRTSYARLHSLVMAEGFSTMADDAAALIDAGRIGADEADRILGPLVSRAVARAAPVVETVA
jgi:general secretion pathway protein E